MDSDSERFTQTLEDMKAFIRLKVATGFESPESFIQSAVEIASDDGIEVEVLRPIAEAMTKEALSEHARVQAGWPDRTDCDRLDDAFSELESLGIVCRQDFSCCGTCGAAEIWTEVEAVAKSSVNVRGYAFYHMQDTESAVQGYGLCLNYGAAEHNENGALVIAQEIVSTLNAHGLNTEWNGTWQQRIGVRIDWKRRRPLVAGFECRKPRK